jgi:hypothetical protein
METKFNYIIVDEHNKWRSTGSEATEEDLREDIASLKEEDFIHYKFELELIVYKVSDSYSV